MIELEKDSEGNVITKPVSGCLTTTIADKFVLLVLQYLEDDQPRQIQLALTSDQTLDLIEDLTKPVDRILAHKKDTPLN